MGPSEFQQWRKSLSLNQREAAELLGLKQRMIQYYEKGERDGNKVKIPKYIRLACFAIQDGVVEFNGDVAIAADTR